MSETRPTLVDQIVYGLTPEDMFLSDGVQEDSSPEDYDNLTFLTNHYIPGGGQDMIEQRKQELFEQFIIKAETTHTDIVHGDAIDPKTNELLKMENVVGFYAISQ